MVEPNFLKPHLKKASALEALCRYEESVAIYKRALEMDPTCQEAQEGLEKCLHSKSKLIVDIPQSVLDFVGDNHNAEDGGKHSLGHRFVKSSDCEEELKLALAMSPDQEKEQDVKEPNEKGDTRKNYNLPEKCEIKGLDTDAMLQPAIVLSCHQNLRLKGRLDVGPSLDYMGSLSWNG